MRPSEKEYQRRIGRTVIGLVRCFLLGLLAVNLWSVGVMGQGNDESSGGWGIVVHGGAFGDPSKLSDARRDAKLRGLQAALDRGQQMLAEGRKAIDVVEAVVMTLEDDPMFNAGRGAVATADGRFELDASIMDGSSKQAGAVANVSIVRNPIGLARRVMENTPHVLLIGEGAETFAKEEQVSLVEQSYFAVPGINVPEKGSGAMLAHDGFEYFGTVGCVVRDSHGHLAAATSTGGLPGKKWGRVGDSPIIGAGTYADDQTCAVSCTGTGELYIRNVVAYDIAAQIRYAHRTLPDAVKTIVNDVLPDGAGGVIAIDHQGNIHIDHNTPGMAWGAASARGRNDVGLTKPSSRP
jgi:L-asparaginase / beta-aspartyl-peptidase